MVTAAELIPLFTHTDAAERKKAVFKAGEAKLNETIPSLIQILQSDSDNVVRNNAARALGKINDPTQHDVSVEALIAALKDSDYYVKANACWSLGKMKDKRAIPELAKFIDPTQHVYMTSGTGKTAGEGVITQKDQKEVGVQYSDLIVKAIDAIGEIGDPESFPIAIQALKDEEDGTVRCAGALALGKLGNKDAVPALIETLTNDKYWYCRRDAAKALIQLKDIRAANVLSNKLSDMYDEVKEFAAKGLIALGKPANKMIFQAFLKFPKNTTLGNYVKGNISKDEIIGILDELIQTEQDPKKKEVYLKYLTQFRGDA